MNVNSGILLIDKDENMTSFDVCKRLQRILFTRQIGHTGTLDPNATGLLVVLVNKATKVLPYLQKDSKVYVGTLRFGAKYDTGDIWGTILEEKEVRHVLKEEVETLFASMLGKQMQKPPLYSAIKVNGKKLYEYARANKEIEVEERPIEIFSLDLLGMSNEEIRFRAHVSSGTYIRTLCEGIAERLGNLGAMSSLRREMVGNYSLKNAVKLSDVTLDTPLMPIDDAIGMETVDYAEGSDLFNGRDIELDAKEDKVLIRYQNQAVAVYARKEGKRFHCERGLW